MKVTIIDPKSEISPRLCDLKMGDMLISEGYIGIVSKSKCTNSLFVTWLTMEPMWTVSVSESSHKNKKVTLIKTIELSTENQE